MNKIQHSWVFRLAVALLIGMVAAPSAFARERQGSILRIVRNDGTMIIGELFEIRGNSLLLVDEHSMEVSITAIAEIKDLFIKKESRVASGAILGLLGGTLLGASLGYFGTNSDPSNWLFGPNFKKGMNGGMGAGIGALAGLAFGMGIGAAQSSDIKLIKNGYFYPTKVAAMKKLNSLARHRLDPVVSWKFVFTGPSNEIYIVTFASTEVSRNFSFPGIAGYRGTYTDDGKDVTFLFTNHPTIQFSGHFTDRDTMTGTWVNNGEIWNWTAARGSWITEVEQTSVSGSKLFPEKNE